jgi:hypothetical protein
MYLDTERKKKHDTDLVIHTCKKAGSTHHHQLFIQYDTASEERGKERPDSVWMSG